MIPRINLNPEVEAILETLLAKLRSGEIEIRQMNILREMVESTRDGGMEISSGIALQFAKRV